jgi:hypothetical protein
MAYKTIFLQPPGVQAWQRRFQEKKHKAVDKNIRRYANPHVLCDLCVLTRHHSSVAREERAPWTV